MEDLFKFLPGFLIIIYVLKKILNGFKDFKSNQNLSEINSESKNNNKSKNQEKKDNESEISKEKVKKEIYENIEEKSEVENKSESKKNVITKKQRDQDFTKNNFQKKKKKKRIKIMKKKLQKEDIIKGVVFKEILEKPRSRKNITFPPYNR